MRTIEKPLMAEINGKEYNLQVADERREYWSEVARKHLQGKRIVEVRYLTDKERPGDWYQSSVAVFLDDGTQFYVSQDDEGNGAGSLFGSSADGKEWTLPTV
jgi:hypothetical protein